MPFSSNSNLDLAQALFDLGGVEFGTFELPGTAGESPIYINPRVLISEPRMLRRLGQLIDAAIRSDRRRVRPHLSPFAGVAGVPMGGLHIATAYALESYTSLVFLHEQDDDGGEPQIEGQVSPGQTILVIDDLMTGGRSIESAASRLEHAGMRVRDAIVLIDREQGGIERLREHSYHITPILRLKAMLNYYHSNGLIPTHTYQRCMDYLHERRWVRERDEDSEPGNRESP